MIGPPVWASAAASAAAAVGALVAASVFVEFIHSPNRGVPVTWSCGAWIWNPGIQGTTIVGVDQMHE